MASKGKEKKEQMKIKVQMEKAMKAACTAADQVEDQLEKLEMFRKFSKNGMNVEIKYYKSHEQLSEKLKNFCFELLKSNMQTLYDATNEMKWRDKEKKLELFDDDSHYLIATDMTNNEPAGFIHLRFLVEEWIDREVLYVYEVQVDEKYRSKGIGKHLLTTAELIAMRNKMKGTLLTLINGNKRADDFYRKNGYVTSMHSPDDDEEADYELLLKPLDADFKIEVNNFNT